MSTIPATGISSVVAGGVSGRRRFAGGRAPSGRRRFRPGSRSAEDRAGACSTCGAASVVSVILLVLLGVERIGEPLGADVAPAARPWIWERTGPPGTAGEQCWNR